MEYSQAHAAMDTLSQQEAVQESEQRRAAQQFHRGVNELFLRYADQAKTIHFEEEDDQDAEDVAMLPLVVRYDDGSYVSITVRSATIKSASPITKKQIFLNDGEQRYEYRAEAPIGCEPTEVLRYHLPDMEATRDYYDRISYEQNDFEELLLGIKRPNKKSIHVIERQNREEERQLGLNDLPVDSDEIKKVMALVDTAQIKTKLG